MRPTPVCLGLALLLTLCLVRARAAGPGMELFLLIGQSNMAGRGLVEAPDQATRPNVLMLTQALTWVPAADPMHFDKPKVAGVGPGHAFGNAVAASHAGRTIGLIPAAFGGTSLDEWAVGGKLYAAALARARAAMRDGRIVGILWHQGEADSAPVHAATYAARFQVMITQLRQDLGDPDIPVVVGETGRFRADAAGINAVLAKLPESVPHCAFVSAEGLTDKGDKLHFSSASARELGQRYAEAWLALAAGEQPDAAPAKAAP